VEVVEFLAQAAAPSALLVNNFSKTDSFAPALLKVSDANWDHQRPFCS
jgi:hypothetical protein